MKVSEFILQSAMWSRHLHERAAQEKADKEYRAYLAHMASFNSSRDPDAGRERVSLMAKALGHSKPKDSDLPRLASPKPRSSERSDSSAPLTTPSPQTTKT